MARTELERHCSASEQVNKQLRPRRKRSNEGHGVKGIRDFTNLRVEETWKTKEEREQARGPKRGGRRMLLTGGARKGEWRG